MRKFGIDISKWQGDFDFTKALADGVEFAIVKGGGGDAGLYRDPKFDRNYTESKKRNLPIGCYWFSKAVTVAEAVEEADYFYNFCLKDRQFELPVYMDVEHKAQLSLGKAKLTEIVKAWCERLESKGYWVGIYASLNTFRSYLNDSELQNYAHWVAQWSTKLTYTGNEGVCGMWQFGGESNCLRGNKVAGVVCDQNYMLIDYPEKIKAAGLNGFAKKQTATEIKPKKTVDELANEVLSGKWGNGAERKQRLTAEGYNYAEVQARVEEKLKETAKTDDSTLKIGDKVKMSADAVQYGKKAKFAAFVYKSTLYIREINGNRVVVSTQKTGAVTGAVHKKYLTKM